MEPLEIGRHDSSIAMEAETNSASNTIPFYYSAEADIIGAVDNKKIYDRIKRTADFILALLALIVLLPYMLLLAILIFIDDPHGSPFYVSTRCGLNGQQFRFIKFRSMCIDAEDKLEGLKDDNEMDGPVFKIKDDPRITRFGRFIRKCSIDELPQLVNVLLGHMSIVGPRPPIPEEVEKYTPYQMYRLSVRPGLTCYWQVQPKRNSLTFDNWVELDLKYILNRNFSEDALLIFKTVGVMFKHEGV